MKSKPPAYRDWTCVDCGYTYHSTIPLTYPPTHRCRPSSTKPKTLIPMKETP